MNILHLDRSGKRATRADDAPIPAGASKLKGGAQGKATKVLAAVAARLKIRRPDGLPPQAGN